MYFLLLQQCRKKRTWSLFQTVKAGTHCTLKIFFRLFPNIPIYSSFLHSDLFWFTTIWSIPPLTGAKQWYGQAHPPRYKGCGWHRRDTEKPCKEPMVQLTVDWATCLNCSHLRGSAIGATRHQTAFESKRGISKIEMLITNTVQVTSSVRGDFT